MIQMNFSMKQKQTDIENKLAVGKESVGEDGGGGWG